MTASEIISIIISAAMMIVGISSFVITNTRWGKRATEERDEKDEKIRNGLTMANIKLDQVFSTIQETRSDIKSINNDMSTQAAKMAVLENSIKSAHNRIDDVNARLGYGTSERRHDEQD